LRNTIEKIRLNIGAEAMIKPLTPEGTIPVPVLKAHMYRKRPIKPAATNIGRSFFRGGGILLIAQKPKRTAEATRNLRSIIASGE
jgi:hypothetical protein